MWKNAVEPPLLQAARLRLRNRQLFALKKFTAAKESTSYLLSSANNNTENLTKSVSNKQSRQESNNLSLEEAHRRIRKRFQAKFLPSVETTTSCASATTENIASIPKEEEWENYADKARQRIHLRFEENFLAFLGFPDTLRTAMDATDDNNCSSWGSSKAVIITSPPTKCNSHGQIVHVNQCWEELCGFSKDETIGKSLDTLGGFQSSTDPKDLAMLSKSIAKGEKTRITLQNLTKDGRIFQNYLRVVPLYDEGNEDNSVDHKRCMRRIVAYLGVLEEVKNNAAAKKRIIQV